MMCDNSEIMSCDDCDCLEKCCLECDKNGKCENICKVQSCKKYWDSKSTEELIKEIASDESMVLHVAVADRLEILQASNLRPATKFVNGSTEAQFEHIQQKYQEVFAAREERLLGAGNAHLIEALIDLQMSCETMLAMLGLDDQQRMDARRQVIQEAMERGYYD